MVSSSTYLWWLCLVPLQAHLERAIVRLAIAGGGAHLFVTSVFSSPLVGFSPSSPPFALSSSVPSSPPAASAGHVMS